ncbi:magnesium transporter CorA family protein [Methylobacterium gnaphalii]|uniref:Magnesium transporter n=1 Tax=Methylobacterium gnaphalii TaxID=1010610 RepID=A0A512JEJ8_9HYPH|nr:magnesium transporter CorA family protein [Methylobacterium gnaphalii]GEP08367.1 magnesium transporter [Methylobacterium gnaphalii]GJD67857.1 Magnesium transport protein CorA [Methylobacterium gnaphalii]GLS47940.1 magnesium transporter [Methylobacterium gnaphalii]
MISLHGPQGPIEHAGAGEGAALPREAVWIDLLDPTEEEARRVEEATGLRVPTREALSEVESSSRLRRLKTGGLSLSSPMITFDRSNFVLKPIGFVLTKDHLVTIRFHELRAYETVKTRIAERDGDCANAVEIFLLIVEELVDGLADTLEEMSADLSSLSTRIFDFDPVDRSKSSKVGRLSPKRRDLALRRLLRSIGWQGKALGKVRASLLGLGRIVPFVKDSGAEQLDAEESPRFDTLSRDIVSLDEFETRQTETLQFLLDAALGLINIEQNNAFRILTVVSVVGIPPTLVASMYGMNFKHMPELEWIYGYPYGLSLIALSALIPIVVSRIKGWV